MKTFFIGLFCYLSILTCYSQKINAKSSIIKKIDSTVPGYGEKDTISSKKIIFCGYHILDSVSSTEFQRLCHTADSIKYDTSENFSDNETVLYFKKSALYFSIEKSPILSFELNDNGFSVIINDRKIKIGDKERILKRMFPKSYADKYVTDEDKNETAIQVQIGEPDGIYLTFILTQNRIKTIFIWEESDAD